MEPVFGSLLRNRRLAKSLALLAGMLFPFLVSAVGIILWLEYKYRTSVPPEALQLVSVNVDACPQLLADAIWAANDGEGEIRFSRLYPWTVLYRYASVLWRDIHKAPADLTIASHTARMIVFSSRSERRPYNRQRAFDEITLMMWLTRNRSDSDLMAIYADIAYVYPDCTGFSCASDRWFSKPIHSLSLSQLVFLVGLQRYGHRYLVHEERWLETRSAMLWSLYENGAIADETLRSALDEPLPVPVLPVHGHLE